MKKSKKILSLALIVLLLAGCGKVTKDEKKDADDSQKQVESNVSDFNFNLINSSFENGTSNFDIEITNVSSESKYIKEFNVAVKDKEGNLLVTLAGIVESDIASNDKITITCSYGGDLSSFDSLKYSLVD